jgi:hypothetical protein
LEKNRRWLLEIQRPDWITVGPLFFSEKNKKSGTGFSVNLLYLKINLKPEKSSPSRPGCKKSQKKPKR